MTFRLLASSVLALALAVFVVPPAQAAVAPELTLTSSGGETVTIDDAGVVTFGGTANCIALITCSTNGVIFSAGKVTWDGVLGQFNVNTSTGISKGKTVFPTLMDLNSINAASVGAGTLTILWSDINWTSALTGSGFTLLAGGTTANGTSDFSAYLSGTNTLLAQTTLIGDTGLMGPGAFSKTVNGLVGPPAGNFSMTEKLVWSFTAAGSDSGDFSLNGVPEPASVTLLGGVLFATVAAIRRRTRRS